MTGQFVSYAQNLEDVMLWRALKHVEHGFYIDVGAYSPTVDSVTQAFYERGWHGINIEPDPKYYGQLVEARLRDTNLNCAIADRTGDMTMHFVQDSGLSTLDPHEAANRERAGFVVIPGRVDVLTLASIWVEHVPSGQPVHFLKVDVEGYERQVLASNEWHAHRPWIVVVEATRPTTTDASFAPWENILVGAEYDFAYADGLNRFYVAREHATLAGAFQTPPNLFDAFVRASERDALARATDAESKLAALQATRSWRWTRVLRTCAALARRAATGTRRLRQAFERSILGR